MLYRNQSPFENTAVIRDTIKFIFFLLKMPHSRKLQSQNTFGLRSCLQVVYSKVSGGYSEMSNFDNSIKVFLDTNILIKILDSSNYLACLETIRDLQKQQKIKFYTFEKCIYEYFNGYEKLLIHMSFAAFCTNNRLALYSQWFRATSL